MSKTLMIVPASHDLCLSSISLGLVEALKRNNVKAGYFKPVIQHLHDEISFDHAIEMVEVEKMLSRGKRDELLEEIFACYEDCAEGNEVTVVQGLRYADEQLYVTQLNFEIASALDARVILVVAVDEHKPYRWMKQLSIKAGKYQSRLFKCIIDKIAYEDIGDFHFPILACLPNTDKFTPEFVVKHIDIQKLKHFLDAREERRFSPPAFRNQLVKRARKANRRIILPEGEEPRTVVAANIAMKRGIANCVLLGEVDKIHEVASAQGIDFNEEIEIIDPQLIRDQYVNSLVELRKHKGVTPEIAKQKLQDNVVLGTMMLQSDEVDGLVSGAIHSTSDIVRAALQLIKTMPGTNLVSSVFFMCLPEQVLVYGDCSVNTNPTAEELAEIAIQSAESAIAFGIVPRVAMISYSTGHSGKGADVVKVFDAVNIVRDKRSDILIDGPLQYDAAFEPEVAMIKSPNSQVAGRATVYVFPDLNTANTVYKAVQRTGNIVCMGPMLQGLRKPVNDLSRGCSVEDIVFTIALTAIQAAFLS